MTQKDCSAELMADKLHANANGFKLRIFHTYHIEINGCVLYKILFSQVYSLLHHKGTFWEVCFLAFFLEASCDDYDNPELESGHDYPSLA